MTPGRLVDRAAILASGASLLLAACTSTPETFDVDGLEQEVRGALEATYAAEDLTLFSFSCPRSVATASAGDVFACVADVERQFVRVQVEVTGPASYDWTTLDLVLRMEDTEALVSTEMGAQLGDRITLDCGSPNLRVLPFGASIRCTATDSGRNEVTAILTVDGPGQTSWELVR